jgi:DNA-binding MarR family transcriptional regulator
MQLVELRLGRPLEDVIREVYESGGMQRDVAEVLGIDVSTVSRWMRELGIAARRRGNGSAAQLM